jgi:CrcB protein
VITVWLALAGGLGAGTRHGVDAWLRPRLPATLPWPTVLVNVTGSLALGVLLGAGTSTTWLTVAGTGFLGGYTTFGTASVEAVRLALDGRPRAATTHAVGMLVVAVAAASAGYTIGQVVA